MKCNGLTSFTKTLEGWSESPSWPSFDPPLTISCHCYHLAKFPGDGKRGGEIPIS